MSEAGEANEGDIGRGKCGDYHFGRRMRLSCFYDSAYTFALRQGLIMCSVCMTCLGRRRAFACVRPHRRLRVSVYVCMMIMVYVRVACRYRFELSPGWAHTRCGETGEQRAARAHGLRMYTFSGGTLHGCLERLKGSACSYEFGSDMAMDVLSPEWDVPSRADRCRFGSSRRCASSCAQSPPRCTGYLPSCDRRGQK